jgi:hypothetical protein
MPLFEDGQLTSLDERSAVRLQSFTERILAGRVVVNAPTRVWRRDVERRSNRLVLKITDAKPLMGWFSDTFACDIVYLTRHPIPQSISCLRNGWSLTAAAYLRDERFVAANLSDTALGVAHDVMQRGSPLQQFVLNWALENVAPMRLLPDFPSWLHVRYEDCVTHPDDMIATIAGSSPAHRLRADACSGEPSVGVIGTVDPGVPPHDRNRSRSRRRRRVATGPRRGYGRVVQSAAGDLRHRPPCRPAVCVKPALAVWPGAGSSQMSSSVRSPSSRSHYE